MKILMFSFGISTTVNKDGSIDDGASRYHAAVSAAFELGPAWQGGQQALFVRTTMPVNDAYQHVLGALDDRDLLLMVEIASDASVQFSGLLFDDEGFSRVLSGAHEEPHANLFRHPCESIVQPPLGQDYVVSLKTVAHTFNQK